MIKQEITDKYIQMIDSMELKHDLLDALKDFVKTYDGSDTPEFHTFVLKTIAMVANASVLEAKADGYDELLENKTEVSPFSVPTPTES